MDILRAVEGSGNEEMKKQVDHALHIIDSALNKYRPEEVAFSFNGGKDSTALLHLLRIAFSRLDLANGSSCETRAAADDQCKRCIANGSQVDVRKEGSREPDHPISESSRCLPSVHRICTIYFQESDAFPEIEQFTQSTASDYALDLEVFKGDFKEGVRELQLRRPIKGIFLGIRVADPHGSSQGEFSQSSPGWPPFMRINPILHWSYSDVWAFLLAAHVPYCSLYNIGYTSIGNVHDTWPNSALRKGENQDERDFLETVAASLGLEKNILPQHAVVENCAFWPAFFLIDESLERGGRGKKLSKEKIERGENGAGK